MSSSIIDICVLNIFHIICQKVKRCLTSRNTLGEKNQHPKRKPEGNGELIDDAFRNDEKLKMNYDTTIAMTFLPMEKILLIFQV